MMFDTIWKFIKYWYFRYLLVTELYMVEKWERVMIHIVFFIIFTMISVFNSKVVLGLVRMFTNPYRDELVGGNSESIYSGY